MRINPIIVMIVKVWPTGNSPIAPGTVCSLFAAFIGYIININLGSDVTCLLGIISGLMGLYLTHKYLKTTFDKDPKEVVIDEFSGQLIASSAAGLSPFFNISAFLVFRFFDILKPGIISKAEKIEGSLGIMLDDWLAGIFSAILLFIIYFFGFINYKSFLI